MFCYGFDVSVEYQAYFGSGLMFLWDIGLGLGLVFFAGKKDCDANLAWFASLAMIRREKKMAMLVLKNASVIPMNEEVMLENRDIFIEDGVIVKISQSDDEKYENQVDLSGKFVMPALWDMHAHMMLANTPEYALAYGVTTVFNMYCLDNVPRWAKEIKDGKRIGADIYTTSSHYLLIGVDFYVL